MAALKERLTVTLPPALVLAAHEAVTEGRADSVSGWVSLALAERAAKEQRLRAMAEAVAAYEAEFGVISAAEMEAQARADRANAIVIRAGKKRQRRPA